MPNEHRRCKLKLRLLTILTDSKERNKNASDSLGRPWTILKPRFTRSSFSWINRIAAARIADR